MVKADPKHDYYADLELPATADAETIKRQFRLLAKQYHPDRNPGKEIEVIPKFQAIQAANEILGDPAQKKRYDADRAVATPSNEPLSTGTYASSYKKPGKPPPPAPNFPPPPKRDPNLNRPFNPRPPRPTSSASAEKFAQFTRAAPQQWDRAKFEDAAKAETLRNLHNMRPHSQGPPPRVPPRAPPTAPKPANTAASPEMPQNANPSPGFPGLSRTNSGRRGFAPNAPTGDEPPVQHSAYAHVHRPDRPPSVAAGFSYPPQYGKPGTSTSPPTQRTRPSMSPLRTSKSSGFEDVQRPGSQASMGRYASNPGEKININSPGVQRSSSVRNSPTGQRWAESGPFGRPQPQQQGEAKAPPPRHHSTSPLGRSTTANQEWSASETSSSDDEPPPTRRQAVPRKPLNKPSPNDPALTGQFSSSNYNKKIDESRYYQYPAPGTNGTAPNNPVDDITQGLNNAGIRHVHKDDVPLKKYENPFSHPMLCKPWINPLTARTYPGRDHLINGIPAWALPASIFPRKRSTFDEGCSPSVLAKDTNQRLLKHEDHFHKISDYSDHLTNIFSSQSSQHTSGVTSEPQSAATNTNGVFSAADWDGKFADNENVFRPQEPKSRSRSPTKPPRPKLPNRNRSGPRTENEKDVSPNANEETTFQMPGVRHVSGTGNVFGKSAAFEPVRFSAEDWAEKLRNQNNSKGPKAPPRGRQSAPSVATKQPTVRDEARVEGQPASPENQSQPQAPGIGSDAMDVDDSVPQQAPKASASGSGAAHKHVDATVNNASSSGMNLNDLKETAPFKPRVGGLVDLGDLGDTLPFESRAAKELNLHQAPSAGPAGRQLNLPAPPKPVVAPDETHLTQESWSTYSEKMIRYMDAWNIFNCKMIDHFRIRQEQISLAMYHNWVTAVGDGASADNFDGLDFVGSDIGAHDQANGSNHARLKSKKAGYATYMQWIEQDRVCRAWWDVAFDEHVECMEELGRVRQMVKSIRAHEFEKHG